VCLHRSVVNGVLLSLTMFEMLLCAWFGTVATAVDRAWSEVNTGTCVFRR